jgi:hypothetical protein
MADAKQTQGEAPPEPGLSAMPSRAMSPPTNQSFELITMCAEKCAK